jgi:hypothetical protein
VRRKIGFGTLFVADIAARDGGTTHSHLTTPQYMCYETLPDVALVNTINLYEMYIILQPFLLRVLAMLLPENVGRRPK